MELFKIDDLFNFEKGVLQSSKCTPGEFDFITASADWKTHDEYTHDCEALVFAAAASGSLGRTHYVNGKFISSDLCFIITPKDPINLPVDLKFYHLVFDEFKIDIVKNTKAGTSKEVIGLKSFGNYKVPYFDINKQIEAKKQFIEIQLSKVDLNKEFANQLSLVKQLHQAFLSEAMQGKLCQFEPVEGQETGQELLERIKAEKAQLIKDKKLKKEKELPTIEPEEIPFEIPENWVWCRLGDVALVSEAGKSFKCTEIPIGNNEWGVIKVSAVSWDKFLEDKNKLYSKTKPDDISAKVEIDDFIISRANTSELVGKSVVVKRLTKNLLLSDKTIRFIFSNSISKDYINICNNSATARTYYSNRGSGSSPSMKNITREQIKSLLIPLPPLSIQIQIVSKLDQLMKTCDELENSIKQSKIQNEQLLQQVLKEALEVKEEAVN